MNIHNIDLNSAFGNPEIHLFGGKLYASSEPYQNLVGGSATSPHESFPAKVHL